MYLQHTLDDTYNYLCNNITPRMRHPGFAACRKSSKTSKILKDWCILARSLTSTQLFPWQLIRGYLMCPPLILKVVKPLPLSLTTHFTYLIQLYHKTHQSAPQRFHRRPPGTRCDLGLVVLNAVFPSEKKHRRITRT